MHGYMDPIIPRTLMPLNIISLFVQKMFSSRVFTFIESKIMRSILNLKTYQPLVPITTIV